MAYHSAINTVEAIAQSVTGAASRVRAARADRWPALRQRRLDSGSTTLLRLCAGEQGGVQQHWSRHASRPGWWARLPPACITLTWSVLPGH